MDINENGVPEKMDADLFDIAYNKVPDGAEYDVFSENVKNPQNGVLVFNDVPPPDSENTKAGAKTQRESSASSAESIIKSKLQSAGSGAGENEGADETSENDGAEYDVFSENTAKSRIKAEGMNRDYLKHIYKEDMEFLNKDVRMTRTGYIREYDTIQENCVKDVKQSKKRIIFHTVIFVIAIALAVYLFSQFHTSWDLYVKITDFIRFSPEATQDDGELRRAYWAMAGLYGSLGWISLCLGLFQFVFFTMSNVKAIKLAKRLRIKATRSLEGRKKDCMLLGQYDASR